ncbi:MAG: dihydroxy-acid dehydratase [Acidobacteriia bacterium]|nr:dihydroxy-acid dehydratase [Terriglobia bacterium]MYG02350.1 dihydroxy-acid dehydratase [Terriglobia bacterium]MYK11393.1 dihydroxy-acid dehydratase [Terriglobia bacterium]
MRDPSTFRSTEWFQGDQYEHLSRRAWLRSEGFSDAAFDGRPVIGICNSWSELTNCNAHLRQVAEAVKRGVWAAGGVPLEFPTISLGEMFMKPTTMLFRNLMSMDVEESITANPIDGVVLLCGCDKTTPAQLMGAASADIPAIMVTGGPMLSGRWNGEPLGSGTDGRKLFEALRAGRIGEEQWAEVEGCISRSAGHCTVMGTASTMASMAESLGMMLSGGAAIPAVDARRYQLAEASGRRIVEMVFEDLTPSRILTREAFENAIRTDMAIGGSTNAVVHLLAIAGRAGVDLCLDDFDRVSRETPYIANVKPSGQFLMEDFFYAGGLPCVTKELLPLLHRDALTVSGRTVADEVQDVQIRNRDLIKTLDQPLNSEGGTAILYGNLAPNGAVIKQTAASPHLLQHRGKALVFDRYETLRARIDDDLDVDENTVMVLQNAGPLGGPGFPEWGHLPIPTKLLKAGVNDIVRVSDARMSGTSFGTDVLHVSPEAAIGGPLAAVRTGDEIELDVPGRRIDLRVDEREIERRLATRKPSAAHYRRGYGRLFLDQVTQAHLGCDFRFLSRNADTSAAGAPS